MVRVKMRYVEKFYSGKKVSRKTKKALIGVKLTRRALRKRLENVFVFVDKHGQPIGVDDAFCPKCGCEEAFCERVLGGEDMGTYPEVWRIYRCARCGFKIAEADNSPIHHCLEFPPDYEL